MTPQLVSILAAAAAVCFGAIGPAFAEGRAVAAAMDAMARQPESANAISRTLFVGLAMIETMAIYCWSLRCSCFTPTPSPADPMQFDWWTLLLQIVNFLVLVWLLHRFLYRPVQTVIAKRRALANSVLADATAKQAAAAVEKQDLERARAELDASRQRIIDAAVKEADARGLAILEEAGRKRDALLAAARADAEKARETGMASAREELVRTAVALRPRLT